MGVVSFVPGRIRLKFAELKGHASLCSSIEQTCQEVDAVLDAKANPSTGSLLVVYDADAVEPAPFALDLGEALRSEIPGYDTRGLVEHLAPAEGEAPPKPGPSSRTGLVDKVKKLAKLTRGELESEYTLDADENGQIRFEREFTAPINARLREFKVSTVANCRGRKHSAAFRVIPRNGGGDRLEFGPIEIVDCMEAIGEVDFRVKKNVPYTLQMEASNFESNEPVRGVVTARIELD